MFNDLTALGYGIVVFSIIVGVGSVVLFNFGNATGGTANTNTQYLLGQLGSSGLAGLTICPAPYYREVILNSGITVKSLIGQDRSVKRKIYARTTDNANLNKLNIQSDL